MRYTVSVYDSGGVYISLRRGLTGVAYSFRKAMLEPGLRNKQNRSHVFFVYMLRVGDPWRLFIEMHIGQLIQDTLKEQGKSVVWFASRLSCHRTNVYKIFSRSSIDTGELERICKILNYDFFSVYSQKIRIKKDV